MCQSALSLPRANTSRLPSWFTTGTGSAVRLPFRLCQLDQPLLGAVGAMCHSPLSMATTKTSNRPSELMPIAGHLELRRPGSARWARGRQERIARSSTTTTTPPIEATTFRVAVQVLTASDDKLDGLHWRADRAAGALSTAPCGPVQCDRIDHGATYLNEWRWQSDGYGVCAWAVDERHASCKISTQEIIPSVAAA